MKVLDGEKMIETLMNFISYGEKDNAYTAIARYILEHQDKIAEMRMEDLAEGCYVAPSTISRFCRNFGYGNYTEFRIALTKSISNGQARKNAVCRGIKAYKGFDDQLTDYARIIGNQLELFAGKFNFDQAWQLVSEILSHENVVFANIANALMFAKNLQDAFVIQGKYISCYATPEHQIQSIAKTEERDLVVAFYFDPGFSAPPGNVYNALKECRAKKVLVTTGEYSDDPQFSMAININQDNDSKTIRYRMMFFIEAVISVFYKWSTSEKHC